MAKERFGSLAFLSSAAACWLASGPSADAADIHVPADQPTIQAAINAATGGDVVLVSPGTYNEAIDFGGKAITVKSTAGAGLTILSGTGLNASVVKFVAAEGPNSVLDGFTISGGKGTLSGTARLGGGIYALNANPTIRNCTISGNTLAAPPPSGTASGAGVYQTGGVMTLTDCNIIANAANGNSSASGGGLRASAPLVIRCVIGNNTVFGGDQAGTSFGSGAGALTGDGSSPGGTFINCRIRGNSVSGGSSASGGAGGGSLYVNCLITDNHASASGSIVGTANGGGVSASNAVIIQCVIANNTLNPSFSTMVGGAIAGTIRNSILFGNSAAEASASASVTYSCVDGGFAGAGDISADPMFIDAASGNYRLAAGSPCIDAASNPLLPSDSFDLDGDGNPTEMLSRDLDLLRRVVNGVADMGAYERQRACLADISPSSPGIAGDGHVDVDDLFVVIDGWGACDACVADVDGNGVVDVDDLFAVINSWGDCP